jgi:hypothetical protein
MKFFNFLTGTTDKASENSTDVLTEEHPTASGSSFADSIEQSLFVDEVPPVKEETVSESKSRVAQFLNKDFHGVGLSDGYDYHSREAMDTAIRKIRSGFQMAVDQQIAIFAERRLQARNIIISIGDISPETRQNLDLVVDEMNQHIRQLEQQKAFSADNEGWVMNAIYAYQQGFTQGLNDWLMKENFMKIHSVI